MAENKCTDTNCPQHGTLKVHGRLFTATVVSAKAQRTAVVEFERKAHVPKYERYERRKTRIKAHNPDCLDAKEGDIVRIQECRPLSKTKNFVITQRVGKEALFADIAARREQAKIPQSKREEKQAETKGEAEA